MESTRGRKKKEIGYNTPFASRLRELLEEHNLTQPVLAEAIGVSRQSVGQWKDGKTVPDILDLGKIATYFGVSTDYLLGRTYIASGDDRVRSMHELTGLTEDTVNRFLEFKAVSDFISDLKEEIINKTPEEIQDEFEEHGFSITPETAMLIKKAPRDITTPTHILNLLFEKDDVNELLKQLMVQVSSTDKLRKVKEINATEYFAWTKHKQAIELIDRLVVSISKNPKG